VEVPENPTKAGNAQYTYTFSGWDKEVATVTGDAIYTATYKETVNQYKVRFENYDGTLLKEEKLDYGTMPEYTGTIPEKVEDKIYTYEFENWDKDLKKVTGDVTYIAQYKEKYIDYTIIFKNEDGTVLSEKTYKYGDTVKNPPIPTKTATAKYTYIFNGWDKEVSSVVGDEIYTATYMESLNKYTVTFVDEYGVQYSSKENIYYGGKVTEPVEPTKTNHLFLGWYEGDTKYNFNNEITSNITLKAKWKEIIFISINDLVQDAYNTIKEQAGAENIFKISKDSNTIDVTIMDITMNSVTALAGTGIKTAALNLLNNVGVKEVTLRIPTPDPSDEEISVTITAGNLTASTGALDAFFRVLGGSETAKSKDLIGKSIKAEITLDYGYNTTERRDFDIAFTKDISVNDLVNNSYTVIENTVSKDKFEVYKNGNAIKVTIYETGMNSVTALGGTGIKTAAENLLNTDGVEMVKISIVGMEDVFVTLTAETLTEKYAALDALFRVMAGKEEESTAKDLFGKSLNIDITLAKGYKNVTNNYNNFIISFAEPDVHQVTFNTDGGSYITPQLVYNTRTVSLPEVPTKEGHTFDYWSLNGERYDFNSPITGDIELIAVWNLNKYNVIFKDSNGTILSKEEYFYGDTVEEPTKPTKQQTELYTYIFKGWDKQVSTVKEDTIYTAVYEVIVNIDVLVNGSYNTIKNNTAQDKFTVNKEGNIISVTINNLEMNSVTALCGTGIKTAAENLLATEGVEKVTLSIPGIEGVSVTVTKENLGSNYAEIDALFTILAGQPNATTENLIGKSIRFEIILEDGYTTKNNTTFAVTFKSNLDVEAIINKSFNTIKAASKIENAVVELNEKDIKITVLNTRTNAVLTLNQMGIISAIENYLLYTPGIESVSVAIPAENINIEVNHENLTAAIQAIFMTLAETQDATAGELAGKYLELFFEVKDGFVPSSDTKFTISYDAIYTVIYNVDGNETTEKVQYNNCAIKPENPTKEGYTFLYWELDGEEYDFSLPMIKDIELVAVWQINTYDITFITNEDSFGNFNKTTINVEYGSDIIVSGNQIIIGGETIIANPTSSDAQFTYTFEGWENVPENNKVVGNATITGNFIQTVNEYTVTWNVDGTITEETYEYGATPKYTGETGKAADVQYTYTFAGWDNEIEAVTGNATYTAKYTSTVNSYKVTWNVDGTITEETYEYGATPKYKGETGKAADAQYTYTFAGWDNEITDVTGNVTYTATYSKTVNQYKVRFENYDGTLLQEKTLDYGTIPTYTGEVPIKPKDNTYTYEFNNIWDKELIAVNGDITYTAAFTPIFIEYTVIFENYDGTVLNTKTKYHYGEKVEVPADPSKAADAQYTYTFADWNKAVEDVTGDVTYTATYSKTVNSYIVRFENYDGTLLQQKTLDYGTMPTYTFEEPVKAADVQYTYTFAGWDKEIVSVTGNVTYKAIYNNTINSYKVTFLNYDGKLLEEKDVNYGIIPEYTGETPIKPADNVYTYAFVGWDLELEEVSGEITYTAVFVPTNIDYTIIFVNEDGTEISKKTYHYDEEIEVPEDPTKAADAQYTYTFTGWDKEIDKVKGNTTYTATYSTTVNQYTVTWNVDGTISEETYEYGSTPKYKGETGKAADAQYTYTFAGWENEIAAVTGNATYTAKYTSTVNSYTVTWNVDGKETEETYEYGTTPKYQGETGKAADAQYTYTFNGWDKKFATVTEDVTYTATYSTTVNQYTVTWNVDGNETEETYEYGVTPKYKGETGKAADAQYTYTFAGWENEIAAVTGNATYTAKYAKTVNSYKVTWNVDGTISEETYEYGATPKYKGETGKAADAQYTYTFAGWENKIVSVTGNATYTAKYTSTVNSYTVTWNVDGEISEETYKYGETPKYKGETGKAADAQYTYTFNGWDKKFATVTEDVTYTATYNATVNKYTVTVTTNNVSYGKVDKTNIVVDYGTVITISNNKVTINGETFIATPTSANAQYTYTFENWSGLPENNIIVGDTTVIGNFIRTINQYTVTLKNEDGTVLSSKKYDYGSTVEVPSKPTQESTPQYSYTFKNWDKEIVIVTGDVTYTALYTPTIRSYTVEFRNLDLLNEEEPTKIITSKVYKYGSTVEVPADPTYTLNEYYEYTFVGWDKEISIVTGDVTYTAKYDCKVRVDDMITKDILNASAQAETLNLTKNGNDINTHFIKYKPEYGFMEWIGFGPPPHGFSEIFADIQKLLIALKENGKYAYESAEIYTLYPGKSKGMTEDLMDYDLTLAVDKWAGSGTPNDKLSDWMGYLATGSAGTMNAYNSDTGDLIGKEVTVTIKLKEGYYLEDGTNELKYTLTFSQ